jgi:hypothetical protein
MPPRKQKLTKSKAKGSDALEVLRKECERVAASRAQTFTAVQPGFLKAMTAFDRLVADGKVTPAEVRAKGDFFNDVLELILARRSKVTLATRGSVQGLLLDHSLDLTYPDAKDKHVRPAVIIETKMAGLPRHPGNEKSTPVNGRRASQDLDKRLKEAAYKDVDIKGEHASAAAGNTGGGGGSLSGWLKSTPPKSYLLLAVRVADEADLRLSLEKANAAAQWFQRCGVLIYGHRGWKTRQAYEAKTLPRAHRGLDLQAVLSDIAEDLRAASRQR